MYLLIAILFAALYWFIDNYSNTYIHDIFHSKTSIAIVKWTSVAILVVLSIDLKHYLPILKSLVLLSYSVGDIVIIWKEAYSIVFFMIGHVLLLIYVCMKELWNHIIVNHIDLWLWMSGSTFVCLVSSIALKLHRKDIENGDFILYVVYIFTLGLILLLPILVSKYIGTIFFVISDVLIGFKVSHLKTITYPLYFISLVLFLTIT